MPLRVAVLASGSGTNLQAILDRLHGRGGVEVVGVASDKPGARALERAPEPGSRRPSSRPTTTPIAAPATRRSATGSSRVGAELVVLAGYMQLLSDPFVPASATGSSTSTRRCCRRSPGSTRSARRWPTASR